MLKQVGDPREIESQSRASVTNQKENIIILYSSSVEYNSGGEE